MTKPKQKAFAIFEEKPELVFEGPMGVEYLADQLDERQEFNLQPTTEFVQSVSDFGVLQNIVLQRLKKRNPQEDEYLIIAGKRRFLAAQKAGLDEIPVRVFALKNGVGDAITLIENLNRSDNPLDEYRALIALEEKLIAPATDKELAQRLGFKLGKIQKLRRVGQLPDPLQTAIFEKKLALGNAAKLANKPASVIESIVEKAEAGERITGRVIDEVESVEVVEATQELFEHIAEQMGTQKPEFKEDVDARLAPLRKELDLEDYERLIETVTAMVTSVYETGRLP